MSIGILLSGGMDSIALTYWKRPEVAFTVDYGQACAEAEIRSSKAICGQLGVHHEVITVDCRALGSGHLAGTPPNPLAPVPEWWPFRNQLLITVSAMRALAIGVDTLLFGVVRTDACHKDGTKHFFEKINNLVSYQEGSIRILVPAIEINSADLVRHSGVSMETLAWAHSCHVSNYACGFCRGCNKHREVLAELGYEPY